MLIEGMLLGFTLSLMIGPLFFAIVQAGLAGGFRAGAMMAAGIWISDLLFAVLTTGYILVAIQFEERDLMRVHGERYRRYRRAVPMILPVRMGASKAVERDLAMDSGYGD